MEEFLKAMIKKVNDSDDLYLNCFMPMNRHLIRRPILVKNKEKLFVGDKNKKVLINVEMCDDIKVTRKENYGGTII